MYVMKYLYRKLCIIKIVKIKKKHSEKKINISSHKEKHDFKENGNLIDEIQFKINFVVFRS